MELWKPVEGWEGSYEVSTTGRIRSLDRQIGRRFVKGRILKTYVDREGYEKVDLKRNGKEFRKRVHRLVASAYLDKRIGADQVDHLDRNKINNKVTNLRWATMFENLENRKWNSAICPPRICRHCKKWT